MKKNICLFALGLIFSIVMTGCGKNDSEDKKTLNVGYFDNITHTQALVMKSQGVLEKVLSGTAEVNWVKFNAGPAEVEALFSGDIDIGYIGSFPAINAYIKSNGDVNIISGAAKAGAILVKRAGSNINSISDLSGKVVAVPQLGNTQHICLLKLLSDNNLSVTSSGGTVNVIAVENANISSMMSQGKVDAAIVPEPWGSILIKDGNEMLLDQKQVFMNGDYGVTVVVARKDYIDSHKDIVSKFLEQHKSVTKFVNENQEESIKLMNQMLQKDTGKTVDEAILTNAFPRITVSDEIPINSIYSFEKMGFSLGYFSKMPGDDMIDDSFQTKN